MILCFIVGSCVFLSLSSGALLAMVMQLGLIAWAWMFRKTEARWAILLGLTALAYIVIDLLSNRTPLRVFMSYATFSAHNAYWRGIIFEWGIKNVFGDASEGIPSAIWFGIGLNEWIRPSFMRSGSMDNFWLVIAVRYGMPGFLLLAVGYLYGIWKVMRHDCGGDRILTNLRLGWVITFIGITFSLCTVHVWTNIYSFLFFLFGAGMWIVSTVPGEAGEADAAEGAAKTQTSRYSRFPQKAGEAPIPAHGRASGATGVRGSRSTGLIDPAKRS